MADVKCWVTGAAGFLGSHLCDALIARGDIVGANDSLICGDATNVPHGVARFVQLECQATPTAMWRKSLAEELKAFKPDTLVHCAATAHEGVSTFSPHFVTRNIFEASVATFSAAIAAGVNRIVYMSSMSRYGNGFVYDGGDAMARHNPPFQEWYRPNPVDCYGIAKVAAEDCLKNLCETHGVKYTILVPHNILGTRQKYDDPMRNVASIMINRVLQGKPPIIYGDGEQKRCFSPVSDCIPSIVKAVDGAVDGEIVNIGPDGGEITINELAAHVLRLCGATDMKVVHFLDRPNEVKNAYCSSDKVRKFLGYKPTQSLENCLHEMVQDIKRRGVKEFKYFIPLEIVTERTPRTWVERLI